MSKRRRRRDLKGYRADERERQADCRERQRAQAQDGAKKPRVSRATLSAREAILRDEIIESWDKLQEVSRARFGRRVRNLLGRGSKKLRQTGTRIGDCHVPP